MQELLRQVHGTQTVLGKRVQRLGRDAFLIQGQVYTLAGAASLFGAGGSRGRRYGNAGASSPPSRAALAFLSKAAKGIKGGFAIEVLQEVIPMLGWSITEHPVAAEAGPDTFWAVARRKDPSIPDADATLGDVFLPGDDQDEARRVYEKAIRIGTPATSAPSAVALGQLFVDPRSIEPPRRAGRWLRERGKDDTYQYGYAIRMDGKAWLGAPGWTIKTPQGSVTFTNKLWKARPKPFMEDPVQKVWTLLYKSGLKEAAQQLLSSVGQETVEQTLRPTTFRSLKNTGTCPACFANVKLANGKIMRHGWVVSGQRQRGAVNMSWHSGPCFGTAWRPFEVSKDGTAQFLEQAVMPAHDRAVAALARYRERPEKLHIPSRYRGESERTITKADRDYERELAAKIADTEHELHGIDETAKTLRLAINTWKPKPLPT
jgi:hypothetical protein